eukprot:1759856-Amphidinium_carterae.1
MSWPSWGTLICRPAAFLAVYGVAAPQAEQQSLATEAATLSLHERPRRATSSSDIWQLTEVHGLRACSQHPYPDCAGSPKQCSCLKCRTPQESSSLQALHVQESEIRCLAAQCYVILCCPKCCFCGRSPCNVASAPGLLSGIASEHGDTAPLASVHCCNLASKERD